MIREVGNETGSRGSISRRIRLSSREIVLALALTLAAAAFVAAALTRAIDSDPGESPVASVGKDS